MPTTHDGKVVDRLQESTRINKPFKPPSLNQPPVDRIQRKRKRVSYKEQQVPDSDDEDDDGARKKKKKKLDDNYHNEDELLAAVPKFPIFKPKPFQQISGRRFSMPSMTNKEGEIVPHIPSNASLGIRPPTKIIPRPLHDPMEDHAIVLFDPTIDDRETDEERKEREKEEAKARQAAETREKTAGMYNPHKSLKVLLGENKEKTKVQKVPVVIDPRLSKVLRPHQIEGVKVGHLPFFCRV